MTLNNKNYTMNGFFCQNPIKKEVLLEFLALLVKKDIFFLNDLEADNSTLKMTLNNKKKNRNGLPSQNQVKMRYCTCS